MEITPRALRRIERLRARRGLSKATGVRVGLARGSAFIKWEERAPRGGDSILAKESLAVVIDPSAEEKLRGYTLDFVPGTRERSRFLLRRAALERPYP